MRTVKMLLPSICTLYPEEVHKPENRIFFMFFSVLEMVETSRQSCIQTHLDSHNYSSQELSSKHSKELIGLLHCDVQPSCSPS